MNEALKILTVDIETRPALSYHWGMFKQNISPKQNVHAGGILMVSMQWVGSPIVETVTDWEHGQEEMLRVVHQRLMEADAVVSKNGIRFDIPILRMY